MPDDDTRLLQRALARDHASRRALAARLLDPIHEGLALGWAESPTMQRSDVLDAIRCVLAELFADDAAVLRRWDPESGCALGAFVRRIAQRWAGC